MSTPQQSSSSSSAAAASNPSNASPNFDVALDDFKTRTGHDLSSHSFAAVIDSCTTPKAILYEYRKQVRKNYNQYRKGDSRLMNALKPIVHGLYTMSQSETTKLVSSEPFVPLLLAIVLSHLSFGFKAWKANLHSYWYSSRGGSTLVYFSRQIVIRSFRKPRAFSRAIVISLTSSRVSVVLSSVASHNQAFDLPQKSWRSAER